MKIGEHGNLGVEKNPKSHQHYSVVVYSKSRFASWVDNTLDQNRTLNSNMSHEICSLSGVPFLEKTRTSNPLKVFPTNKWV